MEIHNKLIRDRIAEIIKSNGEIPEVEVLDDADYAKKLDEKLLEECGELFAADNKDSIIEEMADILEVIYAKADLLGIVIDEIEKVRLEKREKRGAFKEKLFLKSVRQF